MLKGNNPLLKINLKSQKSFLFKLIKNIIDSIYLVFDLILENPIENIWLESFNIVIGYCQIIVYITDKTVSIIFIYQIIFGEL